MKIATSAVILALLLQIPALAVAQTQKASVGGVVLNADGEPIPNIRVTLGKLGLNLDDLTRNFVGDRDMTFNTDTLKGMLQTFSPIPDAASAVAVLRSLRLDDIRELTIAPTGVSSVVYTTAPPVIISAKNRWTLNGFHSAVWRMCQAFPKKRPDWSTPAGDIMNETHELARNRSIVPKTFSTTPTAA